MRRLPTRRPSAQAAQHPTHAKKAFSSLAARLLLSLLLSALFVFPAWPQDSGSAESEFFGKGVAIKVIVHDASGEPIAPVAVVKLFRNGTLPAGQAETSNGRAELVVNNIGDFTLVVQAAGYGTVQKELSIGVEGKAEIDVYLRSKSASANPASVPGRPLLAPKAKKAVDEGLQALGADKMADAQKQAGKAVELAPGHPDVLYLQGVIFLKQREWSRAQEVLEKATQMDPSNAQAHAALGMALCDQGKYDAAVVPLEKALQLNPSPPWDTRWTLAKVYYRQARYEQALQMSQAALSSSNGKAPEIELLVAQSLTAVGRYEEAAEVLRKFIHEHADRRETATARRWLDHLAANGKIRVD